MNDTASKKPGRWLVTGVSSGFGRGIAQAALARGDVVVGTLRRPEQFEAFSALAPGRAFPIQLDVTDDAAVEPAVRSAIEQAGGLDVLVNNAGYPLMGPAEDITLAEARKQIETNFFGVLKMTRAVVPHFRAQGHGRIINISSVAAVVGFPLNSLYVAAKHAVYGFSEAMAGELAPFGIKVTSLEPGGFKTEFGAGSLALPARTSEPYVEAMDTLRARMASFAQRATNDPGKGGAAIVALADLEDPPVHLALGEDGYGMITGALQKRLADYEKNRELGFGTAHVE
jgi:NAD(P)-dependent dehydrogenase (short-subunit alcohol dehydrogenase family)